MQAGMHQHPRECAGSDTQLVRLPFQGSVIDLVEANRDCSNHATSLARRDAKRCVSHQQE
jgi:hypothetical protein